MSIRWVLIPDILELFIAQKDLRQVILFIARKDLKISQHDSGFHLCLSSVFPRLCGPSEKDMQSLKKYRKLTVLHIIE